MTLRLKSSSVIGGTDVFMARAFLHRTRALAQTNRDHEELHPRAPCQDTPERVEQDGPGRTLAHKQLLDSPSAAAVGAAAAAAPEAGEAGITSGGNSLSTCQSCADVDGLVNAARTAVAVSSAVSNRASTSLSARVTMSSTLRGIAGMKARGDGGSICSGAALRPGMHCAVNIERISAPTESMSLRGFGSPPPSSCRVDAGAPVRSRSGEAQAKPRSSDVTWVSSPSVRSTMMLSGFTSR